MLARRINLLITFLSLVVFAFLFPYLAGDVGRQISLDHLTKEGGRAAKRTLQLRADHGVVTFAYFHIVERSGPVEGINPENLPQGFTFRQTNYRAEAPEGPSWHEKIGFHFEHYRSGLADPVIASEYAASVPVLLPLLLSTLFPIRAYMALRRAAKRPSLACPKCHYDLRATNTGRCPECGIPFNKEKLEKSNTTIALYKFPLPPNAAILPPERLNQICKDCFQQAARSHPFLRPQYALGAFLVAMFVTSTVFTFFLPTLLLYIIFVAIFVPAFYVALHFYKRQTNRILTPLLASAISAELAAQPAPTPTPSPEPHLPTAP